MNSGQRSESYLVHESLKSLSDVLLRDHVSKCLRTVLLNPWQVSYANCNKSTCHNTYSYLGRSCCFLQEDKIFLALFLQGSIEFEYVSMLAIRYHLEEDARESGFPLIPVKLSSRSSNCPQRHTLKERLWSTRDERYWVHVRGLLSPINEVFQSVCISTHSDSRVVAEA